MNFKALLAAGAFAVTSMAASLANASLIDIVDGGGDIAVFPQGALTLDFDAVDTAAVFDTTSTRFNFQGAGSGNDMFTVNVLSNRVLQFGNLVLPGDFDTATLDIDGTVIDLLAVGNSLVSVPVSPMFTVQTNFVASDPAGTYDFTLIATPIPLPAGVLLMGTALAGFGVMRRKAKKAAA